MANNSNATNVLDLGSLLGTDVSKNLTEGVLESLLQSVENLQTNTTVTGTGNIFKCAISLSDFNFGLNMDLFKVTPTKMDYILLKKIQYLRRLITDINDIFISLVQDLECCTGDDRYNRTVVPIFKWLVEDKNGLCGSLLSVAKNINEIYLPLKRVLCLFKVIPGNPTLGMAGVDIYKYLYPIVDGMEKVMNMLDNGRFLDILIIPIKDFHDKLVACSNGQKANFYSGYTKIQDVISDAVYSELTANMIDSIKAIQGTVNNEVTGSGTLPTPPTPPTDDFKPAPPTKSPDQTYEDYSKSLYEWNIQYTKYRRDHEREYDAAYAEYLKALAKYKQTYFEKHLSTKNDTFQNSSYTLELSVEEFKNKYRSICGCLGEIFRLDGLFVPKETIIRSETDLTNLIGSVQYQGVSVSNYYDSSVDEDDRKIKIIQKSSLADIRSSNKETSFTETMKYPFVKAELLERVNAADTVEKVILLNGQLRSERDIIKGKLQKATNFYDSLNSSFYNLYLKELNDARVIMNNYKTGITSQQSYEDARKKIYMYSEYPPGEWLSNDKTLPVDLQNIYGNITYLDMVKGTEELTALQTQIDEYNEAIGRNYSAFKIVDDTSLECGCDLLCKILKYLIGMIMQIVKLLLSYITKYLANAIANKELMWWIKFIQSKIQCIVDLANLSNDLKEMERKFDNEIKNAEGMIRNIPESLTSCSSSKSSVIDSVNLAPLKANVSPTSIKDITWTPTTYPDFGYGTGSSTEYDITPTFQNTFNLDTNVSSIPTQWKNRTIPTLDLNCANEHHVVVDWVPTGSNWKMFMNVIINQDQFLSTNEVVLNGNLPLTETEILAEANASVVYKLMKIPVDNSGFWFKFQYENNIIEYKNSSDILNITTEYFSIGSGDNLKTWLLSKINKIWFWVEDLPDTDKYFKVYDADTSTSIQNYLKETKANLAATLETLKAKANTITEFETPEATNNKICSASSLKVETFEPVYNDKTLSMYPGDLVYIEDSDGIKTWSFTPKSYDIVINGEHTTEYFIGNNTPFKLVMVNGAGTKFTVVLLIDICVPTNVIKTNYSKDVDGIFLNGRYDYIEFDSIPNTSVYRIDDKQIIAKLKSYLQNIGAISGSTVGVNYGVDASTIENVVSSTLTNDVYSNGFDTNQDISNATKVVGNLPNSIKTSISKFDVIYNNLIDAVDSVKTLETEVNNAIVPDVNTPDVSNLLVKPDSKIGIPLAVLNEEQNIILTIHEKRLKLININNNYSLNVPLMTGEIDYLAGEQLFIEFSTTGFTHTISWTNERKVSGTATIMSTNSISLKPTQLGSVWKDGVCLALMCGQLLDIIFTESSKTKDDWLNNTNTYRPNGTIGYYDFSVFDGYNVYAIPEFFKVTQLGKLATTKGILYESKEFTREEILIKIQNNDLNSILQNDVVIVGEKPITVGGDFIWKNNVYYKNVTFGYLDNFFCRNNLSESSFTISCWLRMKDSITNGREDYIKKYIFSDTHNGNFIWLEKGMLNIQLFGQALIQEPVHLLFKDDINATNPVYVEKWFHHVFSYDKANAMVYYTIEAIDQKRNFDINYDALILNKTTISIPLRLSSIGKKIKFSLVTMLGRYDVKTLKYTDFFDAEITALAIWNEYKDTNFIKSIFDYQRRIIINEMD